MQLNLRLKDIVKDSGCKVMEALNEESAMKNLCEPFQRMGSTAGKVITCKGKLEFFFQIEQISWVCFFFVCASKSF